MGEGVEEDRVTNESDDKDTKYYYVCKCPRCGLEFECKGNTNRLTKKENGYFDAEGNEQLVIPGVEK